MKLLLDFNFTEYHVRVFPLIPKNSLLKKYGGTNLEYFNFAFNRLFEKSDANWSWSAIKIKY